MTRWLSGLSALAVVAGAAHADPAARRVGFREAIDLSLHQNATVAIAKQKADAAEAKAKGVKAKRLPGLSVEATGSLYREPYALPFGTQVFTLHERETSTTFVTLSQPLTGLAYLSELVGAEEHDASAAREDLEGARLETAYRTADAYIHVLELRAAADVAHRSVADIQSELDQAIQMRKADTNTDIDVLRFRSAKSAADQEALRADTDAQNALSRLVVQLGLQDGTAIDIGDDLPEEAPPLAMTLDQAISRALAARPELRASRDRVAGAQQLRKAAWEKYLPDIRAVGVWQHMTGVQPFQPEDEEFLGLRLSWNVWDWGSTHQAVKEAEATQRAMQLMDSQLVEQIRLGVREQWLDAKTAFDSIAAAKTGQQTADEALRLQKARFDAGASTTTDVLDAETEAARARLRLAMARYDYYLALVKLARGVGDLPQP